MSVAEQNKELIIRFWNTLYGERDYDAVGAFFSEDALYEDVPAPDNGARGPKAIAKRLKIGLEVIDDHVHHLKTIVSDEGGNVVTEHVEDWHFHTGEVVSLPFVSMQRVEDGKITRWSDYFDLQTLMGNAPQWWLERLANYSEEDFYKDD